MFLSQDFELMPPFPQATMRGVDIFRLGHPLSLEVVQICKHHVLDLARADL